MTDNNSLDKYLADVGRTKPLSQDEERSLSEAALRGDDKAAETLALANLRFVVALAKQYAGKGIDMEDLISEGNIGLMRAAAKFDAARCKGRFVSYAAPMVRKCMEEAIASQAGLYRVPRGEHTPAEERRNRPLSVDAPLGGRENVNLLALLNDPDAPAADADYLKKVKTEEIKAALEALNPRERQVITQFYGIDTDKLTLAEIASAMGIKRERARQLRDTARRKIRKRVRN